MPLVRRGVFNAAACRDAVLAPVVLEPVVLEPVVLEPVVLEREAARCR